MSSSPPTTLDKQNHCHHHPSITLSSTSLSSSSSSPLSENYYSPSETWNEDQCRAFTTALGGSSPRLSSSPSSPSSKTKTTTRLKQPTCPKLRFRRNISEHLSELLLPDCEVIEREIREIQEMLRANQLQQQQRKQQRDSNNHNNNNDSGLRPDQEIFVSKNVKRIILDFSPKKRRNSIESTTATTTCSNTTLTTTNTTKTTTETTIAIANHKKLFNDEKEQQQQQQQQPVIQGDEPSMMSITTQEDLHQSITVATHQQQRSAMGEDKKKSFMAMRAKAFKQMLNKQREQREKQTI